MTYSNDVFTFLIYKFRYELDYNSIELVAQKEYQIAPETIELSDIVEIYNTTLLIEEPENVPFPQADKFERIVDLLGLLYESDLSQQEVTQAYQFDKRQTQYYISACIYFGLVHKEHNFKDEMVRYSLSDNGRIILQKTPKKKYLALIGQILQHEVFYKTIQLYITKGERPSKDAVIQIMCDANINLDKNTTIPRRAQTVLAWVDWILRLCRATWRLLKFVISPLSATANFTSYSAEGFGAAEQQRLADLADQLRQRGITVVISNHDTPFTRSLYATADEQQYFGVQRHISCDGANRTKANEVLAIYRACQM